MMYISTDYVALVSAVAFWFKVQVHLRVRTPRHGGDLRPDVWSRGTSSADTQRTSLILITDQLSMSSCRCCGPLNAQVCG